MASVQNPLEVESTLRRRLEAACVAHRDAMETAAAAAERRRRLIVEAIDSGMRQTDVAALVGVARSRLHRILVTEYSRP